MQKDAETIRYLDLSAISSKLTELGFTIPLDNFGNKASSLGKAYFKILLQYIDAKNVSIFLYHQK